MQGPVVITFALKTQVPNSALYDLFHEHLKTYKQYKFMLMVSISDKPEVDYDVTSMVTPQQFKGHAKALIALVEHARFKKILTLGSAGKSAKFRPR